MGLYTISRNCQAAVKQTATHYDALAAARGAFPTVALVSGHDSERPSPTVSATVDRPL